MAWAEFSIGWARRPNDRGVGAAALDLGEEKGEVAAHVALVLREEALLAVSQADLHAPAAQAIVGLAEGRVGLLHAPERRERLRAPHSGSHLQIDEDAVPAQREGLVEEQERGLGAMASELQLAAEDAERAEAQRGGLSHPAALAAESPGARVGASEVHRAVVREGRSDVGGERAASMYCLIGSAKLNDIDPEAYLSTVLSRIADHPINRIDELLPWNIHPAQPVSLQKAA